MHPRNRTWILPLLLALETGPWTAAEADQPRDANPPKPETIPVRVARLAARDIERTLEYVGDIKGQDEAMVYPKVSGKISEKLKEDGAKVREGDVLATIDRDEVGLKFEKAPVESPLAGVVGRVYVDRGASVSPQTPVALVVNMDRVRVRLDVPEKYLPSISLNQSAKLSVDAWAGQIFTGKVSKISPIVDLDTRTAPIEISADPDRFFNPDEIKSDTPFHWSAAGIGNWSVTREAVVRTPSAPGGRNSRKKSGVEASAPAKIPITWPIACCRGFPPSM